MEKRKDDATFVIKASYLEIYNEKVSRELMNIFRILDLIYFLAQVIDLLNPGAKRSNLTVRWNKRSRAFVVDNLFRSR